MGKKNSCGEKLKRFSEPLCVNADVLWKQGFRLVGVSPVAEPSASRQGASGFGSELQLKAFH